METLADDDESETDFDEIWESLVRKDPQHVSGGACQMKTDERVECACCRNKTLTKVGGVPLCGVHVNQLKRRLGWPHNPFVELHGMTRESVRVALGFLVP
jgi:hypothetical protein